jgi:hypothetical protein
MLYIFFPRPDRPVILNMLELSRTLMIILVSARQRRPHSLEIVWNLWTNGTGVEECANFRQ